MEDSASPFVLDRPSNSGLQVLLHPLALLNMSDHYTRTSIQFPSENRFVLGALYGTQSGREVSIHTTFELLCVANKRIDGEYFLTKTEQMKQVFSDYDVLGWYLVSSNDLNEVDLSLHEQMQIFNENPLYLRLDPRALSVVTGTLPATIYDTETVPSDGKMVTRFATIPYTLETADAERIAVDHAAKLGVLGEHVPGEKDSALFTQITNQRGAVKMLRDRVYLLRQYVSAVKQGKLPPNAELLREIAGVLHRLPVIEQDDEWSQHYSQEQEDATLTAHLSTLTKAISNLHEASGMGRKGRAMGKRPMQGPSPHQPMRPRMQGGYRG
ncbi:COP9 signalosome subunit 6 [Thamnocephalis sphaerospora]|uniref:COP9 signalosome complex subunit 6 n=1 Tax=Thamnocephalis sphaerospora TaxID=78915 RepID=A0A4P9XPJ5_9FUNG|nr:COP9 signalosome subunit 6 [Thamnocephalis sphaerospora]|eukprot:RKP07802.1 COP9 signalosome subunit 6 [Thamnocephalis sphaerospora]